MEPKDVTPVELRDGMYYKREDLFARPSGANGSKLRACFHLVERAKGKVARYLNREALLGNADWWGGRDESVLFWIVGGPLR